MKKQFTYEEIDRAARMLAETFDGITPQLWSTIDELERLDYRMRAGRVLDAVSSDDD